MAITHTRTNYPGVSLNGYWGYHVSASGPYVLVGWNRTSNNNGLWLYKRDGAGVLQLVLERYEPTSYPPSYSSKYGAVTACWYNAAESRLEIIVSATNDPGGGLLRGAVFFMDWLDSGTVAGDMNELGLVYGDVNYDRMGHHLAILDSRAGAIAGNSSVYTFSRSGDVWSKLARSTSYTDLTTYSDITMWQVPDSRVIIAAIGAPAYLSTVGKIYLLENATPGSSWSDLKTILGAATLHYIGAATSLGDGGNGTCSLVSGTNKPLPGIRIWDMDPADHTVWTDLGIIKSIGGSLPPAAVAVGYKVVFFGSEFYNILGNSNVGAVNVAQFSGSWPIDDFADELLYTTPVTANVYQTRLDSLALAYQEGGFIRVVAGEYWFPVPGGTLGAIAEYNGDLDWPSPPNPTPVDQTYQVSTVTVIARDVIKVTFNSAVAITESLITASSYQISGGSYEVAVDRVLPIVDGQNAETTSVYLALKPKALPGDAYEITIPSAGAVLELQLEDPIPDETLYTPDGDLIAAMTAEWFHHRTKIDSVLASFPGSYSMDLDSSLRMILQAITISDEAIGGDF